MDHPTIHRELRSGALDGQRYTIGIYWGDVDSYAVDFIEIDGRRWSDRSTSPAVTKEAAYAIGMEQVRQMVGS